MATVGHMMSQVMKGKVTGTDSVSNVIYKQFKQITVETTLGQLSRMLDTDHYVLVVHDQRQCKSFAFTLLNVVPLFENYGKGTL